MRIINRVGPALLVLFCLLLVIFAIAAAGPSLVFGGTSTISANPPTIEEYTIYGEDGVFIGVGSQIGGLVGARTNMQVNGDAVGLNGAAEIIGDTRSGYDVTLGNNAHITGALFITNGAVLTLGSGATVGTTNIGDPQLPGLPSATVFTCPTGGTNYSGANSQSLTLSPGVYGTVNFGSLFTLTLNGTGDYYFDAISTANGAKIVLTTPPVRMFVCGAATFGSLSIFPTNLSACEFFMEVHSNDIENAIQAIGSSHLIGSFFAPFGGIHVGSGGGGATFTGQLVAAHVDIEHGVLGTNITCLAPGIICGSQGISTNLCGNLSSIVLTYPSPTVVTGSFPVVGVACNPPSGSSFSPGDTTVSCCATDSIGTVACCTFNVHVAQLPLPSCTVNPSSTNVCAGSSVQFCASGSGGTPPYTYFWNTGETTPCITTNAAGTYSVTVTDSKGCSTQCSGRLFVNPNPSCTVSPASTNICDGSTTQFCVTPSGGSPPYSVVWSSGETTPCITKGAVGTYTATVTDSKGCSTQCSGTLVVNPNPTCTVNPASTNICDGSVATFCATGSGGTGPYTYLWSSGETTQCITTNATGTYSVTVTDSKGCSSTQCSGSLVVHPNPTCMLLAPDPLPACGSSGNTLSGPAGFVSYSWKIIAQTDPGWLITGGITSQTVTYTAGNSGTATFQLTVTDQFGCSGTCQVTFGCSGCQWCTKSAVQSQVTQNMGTCTAQPDIIVDVRLGFNGIITNNVGTPQPATGSLQAAVDYINAYGDVNGDGYLFIGVIAQDCTDMVGTGQCLAAGTIGRPFGGPAGSENVIVTNSRPQRLNIFGCSVTLQAKDPSQPVITVKNSVGKVTILDIHVTGSSVCGYLVTNNNDLVVIKNSRALNNDIGYCVNDDNVEITGAPEISSNRIGIQVGGSNVTLRTNSDVRKNTQFGILVLGNGNELNGNEVGVSGFPNAVGIKIAGNGNNVHDDGVAYNTNEGIIVTGNNNTLHGEDSESNGGDGIKVTGANNLLDSNRTVQKNGGNGINADSANGASGNMLKGNQTDKNALQGTRACGQIDQGGNTGSGNGVDPQVDFFCVAAADVRFFIPDGSAAKVFKYDAAGHYAGTFSLAAANSDARGAATIGLPPGNSVYVLDKTGKKVFKYTDAGGVPAVSRVLATNATVTLTAPAGLAISADDLWVVDDSRLRLFRYSLAAAFSGSGNLPALQQITLSTGSGNGSAEGLAIDATYLYVLDDADKQVYRYARAGGVATVSKVLKDSSGGSLSSPSGANVDGGYLYVTDKSKRMVYKYSVATLFGSGSINATSQFSLAPENQDPEGL